MKINGNGSVVQLDKGAKSKCRHWRLKVSTDVGQKSKRFTGTYTQAKAELEHFKASLMITRCEVKFGDYCEKWINRRIKLGQVCPETIKKDRQVLKKLIPKFGEIKLSDLNPEQLLDGLLEIKDERNLSNTTMNGIFIKIKSILQEAYAFGLISKNPMEHIKSPQPEKSNRKALTENQFLQFLLYLNSLPIDGHTMAARLAVLGGLRRGEISGLNWCDRIDHKFLEVNRSFSSLGRLKTTKTPRGIRTIPLTSKLAEDLDVWHETQRKQLDKLGIVQTEQTPIITSIVGDRIHPDNLERWWRNNRSKFGLSEFVLHELRHTYLTMLGNNGATLNTLMSLAGWSDPSMAAIYIHRDRDADIRTVNALDFFIENGTFGGTLNGTFLA